jgi:hypothetical protein
MADEPELAPVLRQDPVLLYHPEDGEPITREGPVVAFEPPPEPPPPPAPEQEPVFEPPPEGDQPPSGG